MDSLAEIGSPAPGFELQNTKGGSHRLSDYRGKIVVLEFWSARCPWCEKVDEDVAKLKDGWGDEVELVHITSNTDEDLALIREVARERGHEQVLLDPDQQIADAYGAEITPEFFLVGPEGRLRYQGALDDSDFRSEEATRQYLEEAIQALRRGEDPDPAETPGYGCSLVRYEPKPESE